MSEANAVTVTVFQKEYKIACPPDAEDELIESATLVDRKMREIREAGRSVGQDRIAIIAAINIAYELLQTQSTHQVDTDGVAKELSRLRGQVEDALFQGRQLELG